MFPACQAPVYSVVINFTFISGVVFTDAYIPSSSLPHLYLKIKFGNAWRQILALSVVPWLAVASVSAYCI